MNGERQRSGRAVGATVNARRGAGGGLFGWACGWTLAAGAVGGRISMLGAAAAALVGVVAPGCHRGASSPELAFARFEEAVTKHDAGALYDALDPRSRWAWMTVQKSHREAYDIILSTYPEGAERERELRRFQKGAMLGSARALFVDEVGEEALGEWPRPLGVPERFETTTPVAKASLAGVAAGDPPDEERVAVLSNGLRLPFRQGPEGGWGFAGLARVSAERQNRALHDVELVRTSAADYERAAAGAGR